MYPQGFDTSCFGKNVQPDWPRGHQHSDAYLKKCLSLEIEKVEKIENPWAYFDGQKFGQSLFLTKIFEFETRNRKDKNLN